MAKVMISMREKFDLRSRLADIRASLPGYIRELNDRRGVSSVPTELCVLEEDLSFPVLYIWDIADAPGANLVASHWRHLKRISSRK